MLALALTMMTAVPAAPLSLTADGLGRPLTLLHMKATPPSADATFEDRVFAYVVKQIFPFFTKEILSSEIY